MSIAEPTTGMHAPGHGPRWLEFVLPPAALLSWVLALTGSGTLVAVACVAAGATTALACLYPWCRRRTWHTVEAATWSAQRDRSAALTAGAQHAARWQAIVDTATEGILTIDEKGTIETANGAVEKLFGWPATELIGKNATMLMPPP